MTDKEQKLPFSQAALTAYSTCPRKFRYRYLDELNWLHTGQHDLRKEDRLLGEHFHLLAQRYFQKVESALLSRIAPPGPLGGWLDSLRQRFPLVQDLTYCPEQELRVVIGEACFTAKYDLLTVYPDGRVFIYDWKTWGTPPDKRVRSLQTQVYSLVLCAAAPFGALRPEDITMVYWNPRFPRDEQVWPYSAMLYRQDLAELTALVTTIAHTSYQSFADIKPGEDAPVPRECQQCDYIGLCYGAGQMGLCAVPAQAEEDFFWDDVEEIPYEEE